MEEDGRKNKLTDWKRDKELDEARKNGMALPEVDEEGRDINPHIPQYIKKAPWYAGEDRPTLKHQRPQDNSVLDDINAKYIKGAPRGPAPLKYTPGACENCGSKTHKKKDCLERPRKVGAKYSNKNLKPDDYTQKKLNLDYDGKRDHWVNFDLNQYDKVAEKYEKIEEVRQKKQSDKKQQQTENTTVKIDSKEQYIGQNLRIREDTAKYLFNLNENSAFYDPISRSMRDNPLANSEKAKFYDFCGENALINSGEVHKVAKAELFTMKAADSGLDINLIADPTKAEMLLKQYEARKEDENESEYGKVLKKYGGEEFQGAPLILAQTEQYVEYDISGRVKSGYEKICVRSKYDEDVFVNNHTTVFGSLWENFEWGYKCCGSRVKNSYCVKNARKRLVEKN